MFSHHWNKYLNAPGNFSLPFSVSDYTAATAPPPWLRHCNKLTLLFAYFKTLGDTDENKSVCTKTQWSARGWRSIHSVGDRRSSDMRPRCKWPVDGVPVFFKIWNSVFWYNCLSNAIHGIGQILKSLECMSVCLSVCPHKPFVHDSDHNFCPIFLKFCTWVTHVKTTTKFGGQVEFPGSMAPLLDSQNRFLERTSSLSQWRAFQRLFDQPIKLSSQNWARISNKLNFTKNVKFGDKRGVA